MEYTVSYDMHTNSDGLFRLLATIKENTGYCLVTLSVTFRSPSWFSRKILRDSLTKRAIAAKKSLDESVDVYLRNKVVESRQIDEVSQVIKAKTIENSIIIQNGQRQS